MRNNRTFSIFTDEEKKVYLKLRDLREGVVRPIVRWLDGTGVSPDYLTYAGLFMIVPFIYFFASNPWISFLFLFLNQLFDSLDGSLARFQKKDSIRGALLDTVCDYLSFFAIFLTFMGYGLVAALWGSVYLLSYVIMQSFVIYGASRRVRLFPVFKSKYLVFFFFLMWLLSGINYFDPLVVFLTIYMIVTNFFLFQKIRCSL